MQAQVRMNHSILRRFANEEYEFAQGWRNVVMEWMEDYERYFDNEEEYDVDDDYDEGIGIEETDRQEMVDAISVWGREVEWCINTSYVAIPQRNGEARLCSVCYIHYIDYHSLGREVDHRHVGDHTTVDDPDLFRFFTWWCESCRLPLSQVITRKACVACN